MFNGRPMGERSPHCLHAASAPAVLLEDNPTELRLGVQGSTLQVRVQTQEDRKSIDLQYRSINRSIDLSINLI